MADYPVQQLLDKLADGLGNGLVATDIWLKGEPTSLGGIATQPEATKLFDALVEFTEDNLKGSGFPRLDRYILFELEGKHAVLLVNYGPLLQGMLVNLNLVQIGKVISITLPKLFKIWDKYASR